MSGRRLAAHSCRAWARICYRNNWFTDAPGFHWNRPAESALRALLAEAASCSYCRSSCERQETFTEYVCSSPGEKYLLLVCERSDNVRYRAQMHVVSSLRGFFQCIGEAGPTEQTILPGHLRLIRRCPLNTLRSPFDIV